MVVPEVDKKLLEELESMGFSTARATRALHFSGELTSIPNFLSLLCCSTDDQFIDDQFIRCLNEIQKEHCLILWVGFTKNNIAKRKQTEFIK